MAKEIERKYLMNEDYLPDLSCVPHKHVEQHYISLDEERMSIGEEMRPDGERKYFVSVDEECYLDISENQYNDLGGTRNISKDEEARVRKIGEEYFITIKSDGTGEREEFETEITESIYESLVPLAKGRVVEKERYYLPIPLNEAGEPSCKTAEHDIYKGKLSGLKTVEFEFGDINSYDVFVPPLYAGKEITEDKRFKNENLAAHGLGEDV